jgi:hypothetical protein
LLTVSSGDVIPQLPTKDMASIGKHLMIMTLLENYEGKTVEMVSISSKTLAFRKVIFCYLKLPLDSVMPIGNRQATLATSY